MSGQVRDATGGVIAGASVSVHTERALVTQSDFDGRFELALEPGRHVLRFQADGYSEGWRQVWAPSRGIGVTLEPAAHVLGVVRAEGTGLPVARLSVTAVNTAAVGMPPAVAMTEADGTFHIRSLSAGAHFIRAESATWLSEWQSLTVPLGEQVGPIILEASPVTHLRASVSVEGVACQQGRVALSGPVMATGTIGRDGAVILSGLKPGSYQAEVQCSPGAPLLETLEVARDPVARSWNLERGLSVRGYVTTENGDAVPGADVLVSSIANGPEASSAHCVTDAAGDFVCEGLLAGQYECWLAKASPSAATVTRLTLPAAEPTRIRLVQEARGTIVVRGVGAAGLGVAQTSLLARREGSPPVEGRPDATEVIFDDLPLGTYDISFAPSLEVVARATLERSQQKVTLALDGPAQASLSGRVVDEHDQPVVDAWVRARPAKVDLLVAPDAVAALTDERGTFELAPLVAEGRYDISVSGPLGEATIPDVQATSGSELLLRVPHRASLSVRLMTPEGELVERFTLAYRRLGEAAFERSESTAGEWASSSMTPGAYRLGVTSKAGVAARDVELTALARVDVTLQARPMEGDSDLAQLLSAAEPPAANDD